MDLWKKIGKALLFPHIAVMIVLLPIGTAALLCAFLIFGSEHPVSYAAYMIAFYTLCVWCIHIPMLVKLIKKIQRDNRLVNRLTTDAHLRVKLSLGGSLAFNLAYAVFQFGLGLFHGSFWFHSIAVYYLLLVIMRAFLFKDIRRANPGENMESELRRYRFCGVILLIMTQALISMVFFITYFGRGVTHHFITTIAMAAFTFTALTVAIVNIVKYRRYNSPLFSASKAINLASALVSMLTLETAMLTAFSSEDNTPMFRTLMTGLTGVAVCLLIIAIAIYMIVKATKELKKIKNNNS
jgi:hypothetical protein